MNLGERFHNVMLMQEQQDFYRKKINDLYSSKLREDYDKAYKYLKNECKVVFLYDKNVIVSNSLNKSFDYINKSCFEDFLNDDEKEQNYFKIKRFLLADYKLKKSCQKEISNAQPPLSEGHIHNCSNLKGNHTPKEIAEYLYKLCGNDARMIERFAVLTFKLLYAPEGNLSTVIYAKKELHASLNDYFNLIFCNQCLRIDLSQLSQEGKYIYLPLWRFLNNPSVIIIDDKDLVSTEPYLSTFKKIMNGKTLKIDNPNFNDKIDIKNRIPVICITDNQQSYLTMKNLYKSKCIEFTSDETTRLPYDTEIINWLRNEFAYLGYIWSIKNSNKHFKIPGFDYLATVNEFLDKYCVFGDDLQCTKKELHETYCEYVIKFFDVKPLSQIKFCRTVSELKCDKIETFRPHPNRHTYLHSFKGIALNKELCNELLISQPNLQKKKEYENIKEQLDKTIDDACTVVV